jgi:hypothetical protein
MRPVSAAVRAIVEMTTGPGTGGRTPGQRGKVPRAPGGETLDAATLMNPLDVAALAAV